MIYGEMRESWWALPTLLIFNRAFIQERGENLDISWLRDESLQSAEDLPEPDEIAATIMEKLQITMGEMTALTALLEDMEEVA